MIRRYSLFIISLLVLCGSLTAALATAVERDIQLRGYVDPTRDANLPFRVPRLGVNADLTRYDLAELRQQLDLMSQAHITWVRQVFRWDEIEPQPGTYDWEPWDQIVEAVHETHSLKIVAVLMNAPSWAHDSDSPTAPPDDPALLGRFARDFAARYGDQIDYYQVWDEPNLTTAWGNAAPRPAHYAALLHSAYQSIHSADPSATVLSGALAPTVEQGPDNISDIQYLRDLYALGAGQFMDAAAAKPYGFDSAPKDRTVSESVLNFSRTIALREEMTRQGDGHKALWASQWGWNSLPESWPGAPSIWGSVDAQAQIQYTLQALDRAEREWPWLGGMILQHWQPAAPPDDPVWGFALIDQHDNPTPLWQALAARDPTQTATNGLYPAATPFARYSGVWTFSPLGADIGWINDSQLEFDFEGQDIALLLREDNYTAYLYPTIDGQQANATPKDPAGNAYIILTSKTLESELSLVPVSRNLEPGRHTLRVVADDLVPDEAQDRWALVGYAVSSGNLSDPYDRQLLVAGFTVLVAVLAVVVTGTQIPWGHLFQPLASLWHRLNAAGQFAISALTSVALMIGMLLTWGDATPALFRRESVQFGLAILTAGLIYIEPGLVLTLVALLILFVILYHRLEIGLALVLFWAPFFLFPVELFIFAFPMAEILVLLTAAAWVLRLLADWGRRRQTTIAGYPLAVRPSGLDYAVFAWLALGAASLLWADLLPRALTEFRAILVEPALFYVVLRTYGRKPRQQVMLADVLLLAGLAVSLIGLWMFFQGEAIITAEAGARRLASVYGSPNNLALFLGRCLPFALAYAIAAQIDRRRRLFASVTGGLMLISIVLSQSAGALFVGVPAAVVAVLLLTWRRRALLPLAVLAVTGAGAFAIALQSARFARLLDFTSGTNFARIRVWQSAINIIQDHPLTGLGLDQFLYAFRGAYIMPDAWQEPGLSHPHNVILDFWVRLGIFGVLVFLWIQALFWLHARRLYLHFRDSTPLYAALVIGMMGSMVNLLAHGLVDNSVYVHDLAYVFMLLLGLVANLSNAHSIDADSQMMV